MDWNYDLVKLPKVISLVGEKKKIGLQTRS